MYFKTLKYIHAYAYIHTVTAYMYIDSEFWDLDCKSSNTMPKCSLTIGEVMVEYEVWVGKPTLYLRYD